jgi:PAS domain S-box-containing protein
LLLGYVRTRRVLNVAATADVIGRLVGNGAVVAIGNQTGDVWTDLSTVVAAPPINVNRAAIATYRGKDGQRRLGASAPVVGTPWAVWVEFPYSLVIAPAHTFLTRMAVVGLGFVMGAAVFARVLSRHITTPLSDLTRAAEAIAGGRFSDRAAAGGRDEIGRLGTAFNTMAEQVQATHRELEARIEQRTARLAETGALLEQRLHELKSTQEELDHFFSLSLDLLSIAGTDGYLKRVNPAWQATLGWTPDELTAVPYQEFLHPEDVASTIAETSKLSEGVTTVGFENRYRCKDGSYRWLQWKAAPLPLQGVIYAAARDITDEKRASRALQDHVSELAAVNHELEAFSYSVSHDLRAPLRHVTGFGALLAEEAGPNLSEQGRRHLRTITEAAQRMGQLIDDLLAFSRMGRAALAKRPVRLEQLVRDVQREVLADANGRDISWMVHPLPDVDADADMLRLALVNLLSNALKYTATRSRAQIEIGTEATDGGDTVFFVRDDGVGFDMRYVGKLFGVFQRLHSAEEFAGTGIGLANVRRIIQRHGGRVWATGEVDRGATFYFSLPGKGSQA